MFGTISDFFKRHNHLPQRMCKRKFARVRVVMANMHARDLHNRTALPSNESTVNPSKGTLNWTAL